MIPLTKQDMRKIVDKLKMQSRKGGKHEIYSMEHNDIYVTRFPVSYGKGSVSPGVANSFFKNQLYLNSKEQCHDLLNCPMKYKDYILHLINIGEINEKIVR